MKEYKIGDYLPFYWRLRSSNDEEFWLRNAPFTFELGESGVLIQKRQKQVLQALQNAYEKPANIGYFQPGYGFGEGYFDDILKFLRRAIKDLEPKGLFTEIGCGAMLVLEQVRNMGFEVLGIDPSPVSSEASDRLGINLINDFFGPATGIDRTQVIFHYDVLEHIEDPLTFLKLQYDALVSGGILVFSVPDPEVSMRLGDISPAMHQHLNYFSRHTLELLLHQAGFNNINIEKASYGGSFNVSAEKTSGVPERLKNHENSLEQTFFDQVPISQEKFKIGIQKLAEYGNEIGLYVPLRALPYLENIQNYFNLKNIRMIDDTPAWNGKLFDGCPIPIENLDQYSKDPAPTTVIFSLTFTKVLMEKLSVTKTKSVTLEQLLAGPVELIG